MSRKQLFVFDLDFTLWNAGDTWCDCTCPPFSWDQHLLKDQQGRWIRLYHDVPDILKTLKEAGKIIAVASRTDAPPIARKLLKLLNIEPYISAQEIYPGNKDRHLTRIQQKLGVNRAEIVFFDDELRNIDTVKAMGISSVYVPEGLKCDLVLPFY